MLLLYGGASHEHSVSCVSAGFIDGCLRKEGFSVVLVYIDVEKNWHLQERVMTSPQEHPKNHCFLDLREGKKIASLKNKAYSFDIVFPIIHGTTGEDGKLQGMLEFFNIPFVGAGSFTSAICMDKFYTKTLLRNVNVPVLPFMRVSFPDWNSWPNQIEKEIMQEYNFPIFIKPCNSGSSIGISKVGSDLELKTALKKAFNYDPQVIIEKGIKARELEIAIIGNYPEYKTTSIGEIIVHSDFYSYEAKYIDDTSELSIPADITPELKRTIQYLASTSFRFLNGSGFARIDFLFDESSGKIYLSEINTLPGFTPISMFPKLWAYQGSTPELLVAELVELGFREPTGLKNVLEEQLKTIIR